MNQHTYPAPAETIKTTILTALQSPRAINALPKQLEYVLAQAMAKAFADMGINTADRRDEIAYLVQTMPGEVTRNLPNIRLEEVPVAINKGILQQFGEFYGLNVATFMRFLMAHYKSEQRAEAVKQYLAASTAITPALTAAQLKQLRHNRMLAAFEQYTAQGFYNDYGNLVFNSINAFGKIPFTEQQEADILEQARLNLLKRYSQGSLYADERERLKTNLHKLLHGCGANLILIEAKQIALNRLFDDLIEKGLGMAAFLEVENNTAG